MLAFYSGESGTYGDIFVLPEGGVATEFIVGPSEELSPSFSPDGRWLAYVSDESGRNEVYVRPYPEHDPRVPISTDGGTEPVWSRDGRELFFRKGVELFVVRMEVEGNGLVAGIPEKLFEGSYTIDPWAAVNPNYDVAPDGRFLMVQPRLSNDSASPQISFAQNWHLELLERVPVD